MPSTGCQTCKIRRIKCDETKPICQRCAKSHRTCIKTTTAKPACLSFHLENTYASGDTKRPRGPRPRSSLTIFRPSRNVPSEAVTYYLNHYLDHSEDLPTFSACMSECVVEWKASARQSPMVDLAVSAVALAIFSRTQQYPPAAKEAFQRYGRLLCTARRQITQAAILKCDVNAFDEFLLTIVLMAWYETVMHQCVNSNLRNLLGSLHSWSHHDGALSILKVWDAKTKGCAPSSIIKQTRRGLLRSAILRNDFLPNWVQDGSRFGEQGLDLVHDGILVRVVDLRHAIRNLGRERHVEAEKLIIEARELDEACRDWAGNLPSNWVYRSHDIPGSWSKSDFQTSTVYVCSRYGYGAIWAQHFAVRMLVNSTRLKLLNRGCSSAQLSNSKHKQEHWKSKEKLKISTTDLLSTIPYCLGRVSSEESDSVTLNVKENITPSLALPIVWPLSVACSLNEIQPNQLQWFRSQLARLGRILGDGALECAGTDLWTHD